MAMEGLEQVANVLHLDDGDKVPSTIAPLHHGQVMDSVWFDISSETVKK